MILVDLASRMMRRKLSKTRYRFGKAPEITIEGTYGIYLNVPLCPTRCNYCPFYSEPIAHYADCLDEYVRSVETEIRPK